MRLCIHVIGPIDVFNLSMLGSSALSFMEVYWCIRLAILVIRFGPSTNGFDRESGTFFWFIFADMAENCWS
jgi:hypothetical protein